MDHSAVGIQHCSLEFCFNVCLIWMCLLLIEMFVFSSGLVSVVLYQAILVRFHGSLVSENSLFLSYDCFSGTT